MLRELQNPEEAALQMGDIKLRTDLPTETNQDKNTVRQNTGSVFQNADLIQHMREQEMVA
jgi:ABC-type polar amino acid transport system ATPase subunit